MFSVHSPYRKDFNHIIFAGSYVVVLQRIPFILVKIFFEVAQVILDLCKILKSGSKKLLDTIRNKIISSSDKGIIICTYVRHTTTVTNIDEDKTVFFVKAKHLRRDCLKIDVEASEG